ncbi:MAG TPA: methylated-DNA--[protein]-cysteine S-methyltransferase [Deltaproteobacteria bacterium]|nr:methylated-DNA--[protein]-cysteine S-methyltransferase [Deltaproteobacteria bacterium]
MTRYQSKVNFPPIAGIEIEVSKLGLRRLILLPGEYFKKYKLSGSRTTLADNWCDKLDLVLEVETQLLEYLEGRRRSFSIPLDLDIGTDFQKRVWGILQEIPYGCYSTYKEIAKKAGKPHAARAVGNACAANPIPIIIPCHRVIRTDGRLGGYTSCVNAKKALLMLEGAI